ncbi:hemerythrin domain-containing protein [Methanobacterium oryzae]|uniref:hemerythrin domain-containing protein n=1 Tax=Methanobacterium oryzae TaxID=69540 RepID=UPI003D1AAD31
MTKGDVYKVLKEEHENVKELIKETIETKNTSKYPEIKKQLQAHMTNEENFLYPPMEFVDEETVKKNEYEHDIVWRKLLYLDNASQNDEEWMLNLKELNDLLIKHIEREENKLFPEASDALSEEAEEDILKLMEEEKSNLM